MDNTTFQFKTNVVLFLLFMANPVLSANVIDQVRSSNVTIGKVQGNHHAIDTYGRNLATTTTTDNIHIIGGWLKALEINWITFI